MKLSDQALGAVMLALQKAILERSDVTRTLKGFELEIDENSEIVVTNPPKVKFDIDEGEQYN
tara:strand:+ start:16734 stop:16919 length:186 start_codon:yes stop_codon:yes gene_type:complete